LIQMLHSHFHNYSIILYIILIIIFIFNLFHSSVFQTAYSSKSVPGLTPAQDIQVSSAF
jgi:hypothetical protein